jgi:hypothetical protein
VQQTVYAGQVCFAADAASNAAPDRLSQKGDLPR